MELNKDQLKDLVKFIFLFIVVYVFLGLYESIIMILLWGVKDSWGLKGWFKD